MFIAHNQSTPLVITTLSFIYKQQPYYYKTPYYIKANYLRHYSFSYLYFSLKTYIIIYLCFITFMFLTTI